MDTFPPDVRVMRIYWTVGDTRATHKDAIPNDVRNPMTGGWCNAIVVGQPDGNQFNILDPYYLQGYVVDKRCAELHYAVDVTAQSTPAKVVAQVLATWEKTVRYAVPAAYDVASLVLRRLGADVPTHTTAAEPSRPPMHPVEETTEERASRRTSRVAAEKLLRPVPRKSAKGRVLQWLIDNPGSSVKAMQVDLDLKKSTMGAHLFLLHRDHGIGQTFDGDAVTVHLPGGCVNPFKD